MYVQACLQMITTNLEMMMMVIIIFIVEVNL